MILCPVLLSFKKQGILFAAVVALIIKQIYREKEALVNFLLIERTCFWTK